MRISARLRRHLSPLALDTVSTLDLPPVRMGLLTKLNLLIVGLIVLTAVTVSLFHFVQQWREDALQLRGQGATMLGVMAQLSEYGLQAKDKAYLEQMLDSVNNDPNIAYVSVQDERGDVVVERRFGPGLAKAAMPPFDLRAPPSPGRIIDREVTIADKRYIELATVVAKPRANGDATTDLAAQSASQPPRSDGPVAGYLRLGMTHDVQRRLFREQMVGAIAVVLALLVFAILVTLVLTKRLVAPMHRLMRAARAVGAGRLDVYVPANSSDELGLLTHTFNHMTRKLGESQSEVGNYQRTLEDKVAQRTKELEIATAHAYKLAQHDILTGLPNRSLLNQRLKQILALAQRDGTHVGCLFLDFDHFKRINDTLGHDAGDHLLQSIAQRLISAVRESDTVARLGGDEFVIILPGLNPAQAAFEVMTVLTRVRESFMAPFRLSDQMPTLTCSIGVAMYPVDAADGGNLIKQADTAMYAAKEAGRNSYRFYTADMNARVQLRLQLETDMRRGLMDDEFFLVYQPQIEMKTGRACGVEALLRWRDPDRGVISPADFIPIAEESGMILALGARVLRDACRQVMQWHRLDMPLRLSVNLSVQQLQHDSWLSIVEEALASSGLSPTHLDLEITESVIITHPEKAVATLTKLKQMGVSITIDDFGTGYSSLSYLARLPIQAVKIDQRFVHGLEKNRNDEAITQAIIALSHSLGLRCIAEGVETAAQFNFLRAHGCEEAQGYLISRPMPEAQLRGWWRLQEERRHGRDRQADLWQRTSEE
jgi:diguanylate cyclase (GGDEF)-like protein